MLKTHIHVQVVPVEEAVKVFKRQVAFSPKHSGNRKGAVKKSGKISKRAQTIAKKSAGPTR